MHRLILALALLVAFASADRGTILRPSVPTDKHFTAPRPGLDPLVLHFSLDLNNYCSDIIHFPIPNVGLELSNYRTFPQSRQRDYPWENHDFCVYDHGTNEIRVISPFFW